MTVGKVPPMDAEGHAFFIDQEAAQGRPYAPARPRGFGSKGLKGSAREAATRSRAACGQVAGFRQGALMPTGRAPSGSQFAGALCSTVRTGRPS